METPLRVLVRACRERSEWVREILAQLPQAEVIWDQDRNAMTTFRRAMEAAGDAAALHIEDDALLCEHFQRRFTGVLDRARGMPIQLFSMRSADLTIGSRFAPGSTFLAAVCFYLPPGFSMGVLDLSRSWPRIAEHPTGCDLLVADYLKSRRCRYWLEVPNLADHRFGVSLIDRRRSRYRRSLTFEGIGRGGGS